MNTRVDQSMHHRRRRRMYGRSFFLPDDLLSTSIFERAARDEVHLHATTECMKDEIKGMASRTKVLQCRCMYTHGIVKPSGQKNLLMPLCYPAWSVETKCMGSMRDGLVQTSADFGSPIWLTLFASVFRSVYELPMSVCLLPKAIEELAAEPRKPEGRVRGRGMS